MNKILGIGNALVDVIIFLSDDGVLRTFALPRGSMQLVDSETAKKVEEATLSCKKHMASGGSAANTIHGLARLGIPSGFIGTVGLDPLGDFFREDLIRAGIKPWLTVSHEGTGSARALVSPDGERTMATFLGAALALSAEKLDPGIFRKYDHLHLEGYLVLNHQLVEKALEYAEKEKMSVSLDLASYNVVEANFDFLTRIMRDHVDIVFANEDESRAFTGNSDPRKALAGLAGLCETAIVKIGEKGSLVSHKGKIYEVGVIPVHCLDTTGAGDLYAAGYLYGVSNGMSPKDCGKTGALLAGKVIEEAGAKISTASWTYIREKLELK